MNTTLSLAALATALLAALPPSPARAALLLSGGRFPLAADSAGQAIELEVTGGDSVAGMNLRAQIGDGIGTNSEPIFQEVRFEGLWQAYPTVCLGSLVPGYEQYAQLSVAFTEAGRKAPASGSCVTLILDTTGLTSGTYSLSFSGTDIGAPTAFITVGGGEIIPDFTSCELIVAPLAGDANLDGLVNFADFQALLAGYGKAGSWANGDFNGTATVDFSDFQALLANYGKGVSSTMAPVGAGMPEPASLALLALGVTGLLARRPKQGVTYR